MERNKITLTDKQVLRIVNDIEVGYLQDGFQDDKKGYIHRYNLCKSLLKQAGFKLDRFIVQNDPKNCKY
tara:strand:- start:1399 stop:1605 length:207 start_codon:yes stop_codon:yes gene_type:complete